MCIYITLKGIDGQSRTKHVYYFNVCNRVLFSKMCAHDLFPCNKTTKYVKKFQDRGLCIYREEIHMRYQNIQRGKMGLNASDVSRINPTLS